MIAADGKFLQGACGAAFERWFGQLVACLRQGESQVLVTVVRAQGSTPRDPGARMWVSREFIIDTIGGGHLEWQAIAYAHTVLAQGKSFPQVRRYALGPSLGQCCGGVVWLMFEYLDADDLPWCESVAEAIAKGRSVRRKISLEEGVPTEVMLPDEQDASASHRGTVWSESENEVNDTLNVPAFTVVVCGAGHVGHAVVGVLGSLPVRVVWLDPREGFWPDAVPANVECIQGDADDIPDLPDHAYWLVLTHSHALDLEIVEAVLQHKAFFFLGLIGSRTKRVRFISRLRPRFSDDLLARIHCPIGLLTTPSKLPAVIAVSVVAQLLEQVPLE